MANLSYVISKEELEAKFPKRIGDFHRISVNGVTEIKVDEKEEYENLHDVVIYCNQELSICLGILIEKFNSVLQYTLTRFDNLVLLDSEMPLTDVKQIADDNWGYEGLNDLYINKDMAQLDVVRDEMMKFILANNSLSIKRITKHF